MLARFQRLDGTQVMSLGPEIEALVAQQLGRAPQGLEAVVVWRLDRPAVVQVAPIVRSRPFPTTFWLTDPQLNLALDRIEAGGAIADMQAEVDKDPWIASKMAADHKAHQILRRRLWSTEQTRAVEESGFAEVFDERGIGGIQSDDRIRCLHTWMASHLVVRNVIGGMTESLLPEGILDDLKPHPRRVSLNR